MFSKLFKKTTILPGYKNNIQGEIGETGGGCEFKDDILDIL
jgi:hypothetical protein